jgi:signal transduction histidine kinase
MAESNRADPNRAESSRGRASKTDPSAVRQAHEIERLQATLARLRAERDLLARSLALVERDRQLIGHEIHDGIVQDMTAAAMLLEACSEHFHDAPAADQQRLTKSLQILHAAIVEARRLMRGLLPIELSPRGIVGSLADLCARYQRDHGIEVDFKADTRVQHLPAPTETILLRIAQEALNNVWKHSGASAAQVRLFQLGEELTLSVHDDGRGFDPQSLPAKQFGLAGIRERADILGGGTTIESSPGQGTTICVTFPTAALIQG